MITASDGNGYLFVASDGGVFTFGDAIFKGSAAGSVGSSVVGIAPDLVSGGYWLTTNNGGVFSYGAPFYGAD
jgi:hypothetical protein